MHKTIISRHVTLQQDSLNFVIFLVKLKVVNCQTVQNHCIFTNFFGQKKFVIFLVKLKDVKSQAMQIHRVFTNFFDLIFGSFLKLGVMTHWWKCGSFSLFLMIWCSNCYCTDMDNKSATLAGGHVFFCFTPSELWRFQFSIDFWFICPPLKRSYS